MSRTETDRTRLQRFSQPKGDGPHAGPLRPKPLAAEFTGTPETTLLVDGRKLTSQRNT